MDPEYEQIKQEINRMKPHSHNGSDSIRIKFSNLKIDKVQSAITKPTAGSTIDAEARTAINTIIDTLKSLGLTK